MPTDISIKRLLEDPGEYWPSLYTFLGITIALIEISIVLILLVRLIAIKINSKKVSKLINGLFTQRIYLKVL
ncbi:hypothetical protein D8X85_06875 [Listeria seeligeri]|nr:hypothetical protein [Listeria seeligeri]MBM5676926.1 hypothetical protein [Listeria seeligeri]